VAAAEVNDALEARAIDALRGVIDPEIGLDVVELGLVYRVDVDRRDVRVRLTMTTPACPLGEVIVRDAEDQLRALAGVGAVDVELVWDPPWSPERMSPAARKLLGWSGR
jgi:metal-sulfur cluster biosynthetic enzyme